MSHPAHPDSPPGPTNGGIQITPIGTQFTAHDQRGVDKSNSNPTRSRLLKAALSYAKKGIPVFPCERERKEPLTRRGFKDASTDPRRIHAWWNRYPGANIGVPTGSRSGLLVLDLDGKAGLESWALVAAEHGEAPTLTARTGGGGTHLYYRYPAEKIRNSAGTRLGPGVDVRGEGGYAVVPPSFTEGPYEWAERRGISDAPAWMVERLTEHPAPTGRDGGTSPAEPAAVPGGPLPQGPIPEGRRNHALFRFGCSLRGRGFDTGAIAEELHRANAERCSPPIPADELAKIAASAARYPAGDRTPRAKVAPPEVLEALESVEALIWQADDEERGFPASARRKVWVALLQLARRHGTLIPAGVRVGVSIRRLAVLAAVADSTAQTAIGHLREAGHVSRDDAGRGTGGGALVLRIPRGPSGPGKSRGDREKSPCTVSVHRATHTTGGRADGQSKSSVPISCNVFASFTAPRLRRSSPAQKVGKRGTICYEDAQGREHVRVRESQPRPPTPAQARLGPGRGAIVDHLEAAGLLTYQEITDRLGYARRDYVRRVLVRPLVAAGVVSDSTGGVELVEDWKSALQEERERTGEVELARRYTARHRRERVIYLCRRMAWRRVPEARIAAKLGIPVEQVREIVRPAVRAPTRAQRDEAQREEDRRRYAEGQALYRTILRLATTVVRVETNRGPGRVWDVKDEGREVRVVLDSDPSRWVTLRPDELTGELVA